VEAIPVTHSVALYFIWSVITAGITIAIAVIPVGLGMAPAIRAALEGIARQPEARGALTGTLILGLALLESLAIYALLISLVLIFLNPFKDQILAMLGH
jgi:F-type H+-transporting ATPase subunit c